MGLRRSALARDTGWMLLANVFRVVFQAGYFVLIARTLGSAGFGALVAALAITSVLMPFAGWGSGNVLVMHVAREPRTLLVHWGNALGTIVLFCFPLTLLAVAVSVVVIPGLTLQLVLLIAFSELMFMRISDTCAQAFQALERMRMTALLIACPHAFRFGAAILFVLAGGGRGPETWASWHLVGAISGAAAAVSVVVVRLGAPHYSVRLALRNARDGGFFSLSLASTTIHANIDKAMLARLASFDAAGIYAAAYRAVDIVFLPIRSLLFATYGRFFRRGADGVQATARFAKELLPFSATYGVLAAVTLFLCAPLAPLVLGNEYAQSADVLRVLAVVPLLQSVQYLAADALTGAGRQGLRSLIQLSAAALNIILNGWLISRYGWQGAAAATLFSAGALALGLWVAVTVLTRRPLAIGTASHENPGLASL